MDRVPIFLFKSGTIPIFSKEISEQMELLRNFQQRNYNPQVYRFGK
jgi:hypothetical protein